MLEASSYVPVRIALIRHRSTHREPRILQWVHRISPTRTSCPLGTGRRCCRYLRLLKMPLQYSAHQDNCLRAHQRRSVSIGRVVCGRGNVARSTHSCQRSPQRSRDRVKKYKEPPGPRKLQSNMPSHSRKGQWHCIDRCSCWCMLRPGRYNLKRRIPSCANTSILLRHRY